MSDRTLTRIALEERIAAAKPGERIIYHIGLLLADREIGPHFMAIDNVARAAAEALAAGTVHLVQRKVMPHIYEYIAVKAGTPCGAASGT